MKADQTYVYKGTIYLPGSEMPPECVPKEPPAPSPGVDMRGPEGKIEMFPDTPLPRGVSKLDAKELKKVPAQGADPMTTTPAAQPPKRER